MPTYRNDTAAAITPTGGATVQPGAELKTINYLSDSNGLTLVRHLNAPWVKLHGGATPATITECQKYQQIRILNEAGAAIEIVANSDDSNEMRLGNNDTITIGQDHEIYQLEITGGSGSVYVYGMR